MTVAWQLTGDLSNSDMEDLAVILISASMRDVDADPLNNMLDIRIVYDTFADLSISSLYVFCYLFCISLTTPLVINSSTFERPPVTYGTIRSAVSPCVMVSGTLSYFTQYRLTHNELIRLARSRL